MTSRRSLFRQEVIDFQRHHHLWGQAALLQPLSVKVLTWLIAICVVFAAGFLFVGEYARKETVVGYLTPTTGTAKIFVPQQGTVKEIHVGERDQVAEGQPLLTIETDQIAAGNNDVNAAMLSTLTSHKELLSRQIEAEENRIGSERDRLSALIGGLQAEIEQLQAQIKAQSERIGLAHDLVASGAELKTKGYLADVEFKRRKASLLEQEQTLNALKQQLASRKNQLVENQFSLKQLPTVMAGKIQVLRGELAASEQRMTEINARRAYVVRSPTSGQVSISQAKLGQFADPHRLQMEVVPNDSILEAELFVPARAIGFVKPGQQVRILYDAFPYQQFGTYSGRVTNVSQTMLTGNDASGPIALKEPAYRVTAALDRPDIAAYGTKILLQADMLLRADIILEKRSLLRWLLDPLISIRM